MILRTLVLGPIGANCFILGCESTKEAVIIDPGDEAERIKAVVVREKFKVKELLLTHAHMDHVGAVGELKRALGVPIGLHSDDFSLYQQVPLQARLFGLKMEAPPPIDHSLRDGEVISFGEYVLSVIHTPGHSPGGVCFKVVGGSESLFSGDTLFCRGIGRTDLWGGDHSQLIRSIREKLFVLNVNMNLFILINSIC